jgi:hypothetical protein
VALQKAGPAITKRAVVLRPNAKTRALMNAPTPCDGTENNTDKAKSVTSVNLNDLKVLEIMQLLQNNQKVEGSTICKFLNANAPWKVQEENAHQKKGPSKVQEEYAHRKIGLSKVQEENAHQKKGLIFHVEHQGSQTNEVLGD